MKKSTITLSDLKLSKVAHLNQKVLDGVVKPVKKNKHLPVQICQQAQWMWGQLVAWSLDSGKGVVKEHRFHPERKWRFDFAIPAEMIGIEYEGINSKKSRHTTLIGFTGDTEKYNSAQALGWKVLRFTAKNYKTVLKELEKTLNL